MESHCQIKSTLLQFKIIGNRAASPQAIIDTFFQWASPFWNRLDPGFEQQLKALTQDVPQVFFMSTPNFVKPTTVHCPKIDCCHRHLYSATTLNTLAQVTVHGQVPVYLTPETVRVIVYMNNFYAFFEGEKDKLHRKGIDTNIISCTESGTNGKYPTLDALIGPIP
jgi:hypothetical protein